MEKAPRHLDPHQSRSHEPTDYENLLGDALESAYGAQIHDPEGIAAHLTAAGVPAPGGKSWTAELFISEMKRLGA